MTMSELPEPIDPAAAAEQRPHVSPDAAVAADALERVTDPYELARLAAMACGRIGHADGHERERVLTELVHTTRAVSDAAQRAADHHEPDVADVAGRLCGAIGSRLTDEPLPVLRGEPLDDQRT